jgi:hypothetical protein
MNNPDKTGKKISRKDAKTPSFVKYKPKNIFLCELCGFACKTYQATYFQKKEKQIDKRLMILG